MDKVFDVNYINGKHRDEKVDIELTIGDASDIIDGLKYLRDHLSEKSLDVWSRSPTLSNALNDRSDRVEQLEEKFWSVLGFYEE